MPDRNRRRLDRSRAGRAERDARRLTLSAVRALTEAEGLCERCEAHDQPLKAEEQPKGSARFQIRCLNVVACADRVRRWARDEDAA